MQRCKLSDRFRKARLAKHGCDDRTDSKHSAAAGRYERGRKHGLGLTVRSDGADQAGEGA
jgi:hypothetical protein